MKKREGDEAGVLHKKQVMKDFPCNSEKFTFYLESMKSWTILSRDEKHTTWCFGKFTLAPVCKQVKGKTVTRLWY